DAINLIAAATLVTTPGAGASDAEWVNNDDWRRYTLDMRESAIQALDAIENRDQERLSAVGDALVETCQDCHQEFKPGLPQMGVTRFPYYPKREED
ncbi:MAG: cytochrome c, partial [Maricaulaceae bacterium]